MRESTAPIRAIRHGGVAAAAVLAITSPPAWSHGGHGAAQPVVEGIRPAVAGVRVTAVPGGPGKLALSVTGRHRVTVLGSLGQPVLRVGPRGVEANRSAAEWYQDNEPLGIATVPPSANRVAPARWQRVSREPRWEWFDHRLHPPAGAVTTWSIPLRVGTRRVTARGHMSAGAPALTLRIASTTPARGVTIDTVDAPLSLRVRNDGRTPITILGADGEVFARIGPRGVEVNVRSPVWLATAQFRNRDLLQSVIDPGARADMIHLTPVPELIWPDPRLVPTSRSSNPSTDVVARWSVPVRLGGSGTTRSIDGETAYAPASDAPAPSPPTTRHTTGDGDGSAAVTAALAIAAVGAASAAALLVRRRRRRADGATPRSS